MKVKTYTVLARAVEEGVLAGWRRGFKHLDSEPTDHEGEAVRSAIEDGVLNAISEVFDYEDPPPE